MHIKSNIPVKFYNYFLKVFYACVYNNTFSTTLLISLFQHDMHFHVASLDTKFVLLICKVELYIYIGNSRKTFERTAFPISKCIKSIDHKFRNPVNFS